jgi:hypothetical protein
MPYRFKAWTGLPGTYGVPVAGLAALANYPAVADVEDRVVHGSRGERVGTLVVGGAGAVFPAQSDVWHDAGLYGPTGTDYTPAMRASDIPVTGGAAAALTAPDVKSGVVVDDITGSYTGSSAPGNPEEVIAAQVLSLPMQRLKTLLMATAAWQAIADIQDDHIRFCEVSETEDVALRPWALIDQGPQWDAELSAVGTSNEFLASGSLMLRFVFDVLAADAESAGDAQMRVTNTIGEILEQMIALAGSGGYLMVNSIKLVEQGRTAPEHRASEGDFVSMMFEIGWGL